LGDGARYTELVALNTETLHGQPDFITPGTVLKVPDEPQQQSTVVVEPGDTLSDIAAEELGDADRYPEIYDASRQTIQPDGERLTDPDLIRPGWRLTIPEPPAELPPRSEAPSESEAPPEEAPPTLPSPSAETPTAEGDHDDLHASEAEASSTAEDESERTSLPAWVLPGIAGSGLLAGAVLTAVRAHRRTQLRYRRPGQTLAPPPPELVNVDKTVQVYGASGAVDIEGLHAVLNSLAAHAAAADQPLPLLQKIALRNDVVTLHFAEPADLPSPWRGAGTEWTVASRECTNDEDVLPPYPMLVSIGTDADGRQWLLNLEQFGSIQLTGDREAAVALARHISAELALNPWSVLVQTDVFGLGAELADLDTHRLRTHARDAGAQGIVDDLRTLAEHGIDYPDPFQVVVTPDEQVAAALREAIDASPCRLGAAVVTFDTAGLVDATDVELANDGTLTIPDLDLKLAASGLSADEATMCAAIVDVTRITPTVDIPLFTQAADGWRSVTDQAGALRTTLTEPRPGGEAGSRSLLPNAAEAYVETGATTSADVAELAPLVNADVQSVVAAEDPGLDADVASWFTPDSPLPRLTLLGPVRVTAHGDAKDIAKRRPYFEELVAFLALHPEGVSARVIADAFNLSLSRVRTDIGFVRAWLGQDPRTGQLHLPKQANFPPGSLSGYHVDDLLVDADLFRRLRARGQSRGAEGMDDLAKALRLVTGKPFDHLRPHGWSWLLDDEPTYDTLACAVVDTAHVVAIDALQRGDVARAREAAETGCKASPYDEVCRLDLARALEADGRSEAAEQILNQDVFNRRDDSQAPIDLPKRTKDIVENHNWGQRQSPKASRRPAS
jgi:LysM repeat protein